MVGKVKVIIPWQEIGFRFDTEPDALEVRLRLVGRTGAIIDYMVRGIDPSNLLAGASRRDAMREYIARVNLINLYGGRNRALTGGLGLLLAAPPARSSV